MLAENANNPDWHYSDEENFFDLKKRSEELIKKIESYSNKNLLLVSHGKFIRFTIGFMMFQDNYTPKEYALLEDFTKTINTGITVCEKENGRWKLLTWNDHAHL